MPAQSAAQSRPVGGPAPLPPDGAERSSRASSRTLRSASWRSASLGSERLVLGAAPFWPSLHAGAGGPVRPHLAPGMMAEMVQSAYRTRLVVCKEEVPAQVGYSSCSRRVPRTMYGRWGTNKTSPPEPSATTGLPNLRCAACTSP